MKKTHKLKKVAKWAAITIAALLVVTAVGSFAYGYADEKRQQAQAPVAHLYTPEELLAEANELRAEKNVAPLSLDDRLNRSAQLKADDMRSGRYFGHINSDGKHGYTYASDVDGDLCQRVSENLSWGDIGYSPFDPNGGWQTSEGHYKAIIDPAFDVTGFAYTEFDGKGYYVQHFCDLR